MGINLLAPHRRPSCSMLFTLEHLVHVSLIVPRLHIKQDRCLGDNSSFLGLLLMVSLQPLLGDPLLLLRLLFVTGSKEVDIIVVVSCGRSSSATKGKSGAGLGELLHSGAEGLDVIVPAQGMSVLGCGSKSLVDLRVSLAWHIPLNIAVVSKEAVEGLHSGRGLQVSEHVEVS